MCIKQFACCEDCGFKRPFASIWCRVYLRKLIKHIGSGEGPHPDMVPCPHLEYAAGVMIGDLACPNDKCPKVERAPAIRAEMEAKRLAKLLEKQQREERREARRRRFAERYFVKRQPALPANKGLLGDRVKVFKEEEAAKEAAARANAETHVSKTQAFREYMLQRQAAEGYADVFDDEGDDEDNCPSLIADGGSRSTRGNGPNTISPDNEVKVKTRGSEPDTISPDNDLGRSISMPTADPDKKLDSVKEAAGTSPYFAIASFIKSFFVGSGRSKSTKDELKTMNPDELPKTTNPDKPPKMMRLNDEIPRSLPIPIPKPGRIRETINEAEGTDAHIVNFINSVLYGPDDELYPKAPACQNAGH